MASHFEQLPNELIVSIGILLPIRSIGTYCSIASKFHRIGRTENFWRQKFLLDAPAQAWQDYYDSVSSSLLVHGMASGCALGQGDFIFNSVPTIMPKIKPKFIATSDSKSALIDMDNNLWVCGSNFNIDLGITGGELIKTWTKVPNLQVKYVAPNMGLMLIDMQNRVFHAGLDARLQEFRDYGYQMYERSSSSHHFQPFTTKAGSQVYASKIVNSHYITILLQERQLLMYCDSFVMRRFEPNFRYINSNGGKRVNELVFDIVAKDVAFNDEFILAIDSHDHVVMYSCNNKPGPDTVMYGSKCWKYALDRRGNKIVAKKVVAGNKGILILGLDNRVWISGLNIKYPGKLRALDIEARGDYIAIIDLDHNLWCNYDYKKGQHWPTDPKTVLSQIPNVKIRKIAIDARHSLMISTF